MTLIQSTGDVVHARDGYGPDRFGGAVSARVATVDFEDTDAKTLFTLPKGAMVVGWLIDVSTAFDAGDSNTLNIGNDTTADAYASGLDVGSTGQLNTGLVAGTLGVPLAADTPITATYVPAGVAPSQGEATLICLFIVL